MRMRHCPQCGNALEDRPIGDEGPTPFCPRCSRPWFDAVAPCVLLLAVNGDGETVLIRQSYPPDSRRFVCVAGYMKPGESAETAALRELSEELGLTAQAVRYVSSYPHGDQLMLGYFCPVGRAPFRFSGEVSAADWFPLPKAREALANSRIARFLLEDAVSMGLYHTR